MKNKKIICIVGPTASGKTELAIKIAKKCNGELINADSRQIYKYLDIATAKGSITTKRTKYSSKQYFIDDVPIYLVDIVEPDEVLTLAEYQKLAVSIIKSVYDHGKIPVIVGGTGLYIDAVIYSYNIPLIEPDNDLRRKLVGKSIAKLQKELVLLDRDYFESLNESDRYNPRRLVRAIELARFGRKPYEEELTRIPTYETLFLSPYYEREKLYKKIDTRVNKMLKQGLLDEVKSLIKKGYSFKEPAMSTLAYPLAKQYIEGRISKKEFTGKWQQAERNYARRQITWFKRYDCYMVKRVTDAYKKVKSFLKE